MLTLNVELAGGPTDFWTMDPVTLFFGQVGSRGPCAASECRAARRQFRHEPRRSEPMRRNSDACRRAPMSRPIRRGVLDRINRHKVINVLFNTEEDRNWTGEFTELIKTR